MVANAFRWAGGLASRTRITSRVGSMLGRGTSSSARALLNRAESEGVGAILKDLGAASLYAGAPLGVLEWMGQPVDENGKREHSLISYAPRAFLSGVGFTATFGYGTKLPPLFGAPGRLVANWYVGLTLAAGLTRMLSTVGTVGRANRNVENYYGDRTYFDSVSAGNMRKRSVEYIMSSGRATTAFGGGNEAAIMHDIAR